MNTWVGTGNTLADEKLKIKFNDSWGVGNLTNVHFSVQGLSEEAKFVGEVFDLMTGKRIPGAGKSFIRREAGEWPNFIMDGLGFTPKGNYVIVFNLIDGNANAVIDPPIYFGKYKKGHVVSHDPLIPGNDKNRE